MQIRFARLHKKPRRCVRFQLMEIRGAHSVKVRNYHSLTTAQRRADELASSTGRIHWVSALWSPNKIEHVGVPS